MKLISILRLLMQLIRPQVNRIAARWYQEISYNRIELKGRPQGTMGHQVSIDIWYNGTSSAEEVHPQKWV